jgi:hypothetical protein
MCQCGVAARGHFNDHEAFTPARGVKAFAIMTRASGNVGGGWCDGWMKTFTLVPRGPFSLAASITFLEGFTPAAYRGSDHGTADVLELAFPVEGSWETVGVRVRQDSAGVTAEIISPEAPSRGLVAEVRPQVERILSLDVDGSGFPAVGERDPVVGEVQRRYPGLRPVGFWSPYEAAAWTIIGHRIRITQAAAIKARMAQELGESWKPYRTWVTLLMRTQLEYETGEITGKRTHAGTG